MRVEQQISTRRLRVVKYRGSVHGTNEYPFLIGKEGISVLPLTSLGLTHLASNQRISSGLGRLDQMLGGKGYFRGSSVLVSGTAGSGPTSLAATFVDAAARFHLAAIGAVGGWPGGLLAMLLFRQKTAKLTFKLKYALAFVVWVGLLYTVVASRRR